MGRPRSATRGRNSPGKKATKYAVHRQIKPKILELNIRRRHCNLSTVFIFVTGIGKDDYRVVSVVQLDLTASRTASTAFVGVNQIFFFAVFFYFSSREGFTPKV